MSGELFAIELNKTRNREIANKSSERNKIRFIMLNRVITVGIGPVISYDRCVIGLSAASEGVASSGRKLCCPESG